MIRNRVPKKDLTKVLNNIKIPESNRYKQFSPQVNNGKQKCITVGLSNDASNVSSKQISLNLRNHSKVMRYNSHINEGYGLLVTKQKSLQLRKRKIPRKSTELIPQKKSTDRSPYLQKAQISLNFKDSSLRQQLIKQNKRLTYFRRSNKTDIKSLSFQKNERITNLSIQKNQKIKLQQNYSCQQARQLFSSGNYIQSLKIIQQILIKQPNHQQALYISAMNLLNLQNYKKSLKYLNKLIQINQKYNKIMYILATICQTKLMILNAGRSKLQKCLKLYPQYYEAYMYLGRLDYKQHKYKQAINNYQKARQLKQDKIQPLINLAECYQKINSYKQSVKIYKLLLTKDLEKKDKISYMLKLAHINIYNLQEYQQSIDILKECNNLSPNQLESKYLLSYIYLKQKNYSQSLMLLEQMLNYSNKDYNVKIICLMIIIKIVQRDFYQACHLIERTNHLDINRSKLQLYSNFCQGVVCLMKRKINDGLLLLESIREILWINQKKYNQLINYIRNIYHMYTAYGYLCQGMFSKAQQQIQRQFKINNDPKYQTGLSFNLLLCQGIIAYQQHKYQIALQKFKRSIKLHPWKPEPYLYKVITISKIYSEKRFLRSEDEMLAILNQCCDIVKDMSNNIGALVFYHRAILFCQRKEWSQALSDIDEAIQRSQQNFWKYFYTRALILACCQNFKPAINQVSVAISLNDKEPKLYLLRSKCLQIEGDGNEAFIDLQTYIALKPQDSEIHKYAGHLLFENGAFEDALLAYSNGEITQTLNNFDVFLTRSKTYFLLGNFQASGKDMQIAYNLKPDLKQLKFDYQMIKLITEIIKTSQLKNKNKQNYQKIQQKITQIYKQDHLKKYGKIFKISQLSLFKAICAFYQEQYLKSIKNFQQCIRLKQLSFNGLDKQDSLSQFQEEENQKRIYINQMYYNITISLLMAQKFQQAQKMISKCQINANSKIYGSYFKFKLRIEGEKFIEPKGQIFQIFSLNNKLSYFLPEVNVIFSSNSAMLMKLCIPYPKVQPPQIYPTFDSSLFQEFSVIEIERKPQAPWIHRQDNSIKFTQKIETYSKLQLEYSQISKRNRKDIFANDLDNSQQQQQSIQCMKEKLKLDANLEKKLKKIIKINSE